MCMCVSVVERDVGTSKKWVGMRRQEQGARLSPMSWGGGSGETELEAPGVTSCQEC